MTAPLVTRVSRADAAAIGDAVRCLKAGGLVAFPTETVYGLGADATDGRAIARLYEAKGRPAFNPLIAHVANAAAARALAIFDAAADALAAAFWPGPLTLVLSGGERRVSPRLRGPEGGIAVRWTSHPGLQRLIAAMGDPLTSTSANRPGLPPAMSAGDILSVWGAEVAGGAIRLLDGGALKASAPSTVVDCTTKRLRVIRPGAIPASSLRESVPDLIGDQ